MSNQLSNQLERFHEFSETRWPTFERPEEASGEGRKALSRYINEYIAELEKSDEELLSRRRKTTTVPPQTWEPNTPAMPMSRQEYIRRQNALFHELTGHESWAELSSKEAAVDGKDKRLMATIELYMAALDEKIYMSADYTRALLGVRDKAVREEFEKLRTKLRGDSQTVPSEREGGDSVNAANDGHESNELGQIKTPPEVDARRRDNHEDDNVDDSEGKASLHNLELVRAVVELRDMYRDLWVKHSQLCHQRDALEIEMSTLRYDHALQYSKNLRLEYATHSLGRRLVEAQTLRTENEQLKEELERSSREKEAMQCSMEALNVKLASLYESSEMQDKLKTSTIQTKVSALYEDLTKLKSSENYLKLHGRQTPPETPIAALEQALALIDINYEDTDKRVTSLIESFAQQYRAREQELLTRISCLEREKEIIIARCDKLEKESSEANADLSYLEQRTLSLVLMLKSVRASLDNTGGELSNPRENTLHTSTEMEDNSTVDEGSLL